jgi:CcmD family protein
MKKFNKFLIVLIFILSEIKLQAQDKVTMADVFYSSGKIYVVLGVLSIIFLGILIFLFMIDKKITNLEKEIKK